MLQVGDRSFQMIDYSPEKLAKKVKDEYADIIDYILLDTSGGLGKPFEPELMKEYLLVLKEKNPEIGLGVAGGLSSTTLGILGPLVADFPDLSIDAEGRLRDQNDCLDIYLAGQYLLKSLEIFKGQSV